MKRIIFYIVTFLILTCCNGISKEPKSVDNSIEKAMTDNNIPSLSVGIIKNGKVELVKGYGGLSRDDTTSVNANSIFQIASQSKMFTGIIVNNLVQEGKLNLEEPITSYFPSDISENAKKRLNKIKLKFLLNHTSGIPSDACLVYSERIDGDAWTKGYSKKQLIKDINTLNLEFEPSSQFQYSN